MDKKAFIVSIYFLLSLSIFADTIKIFFLDVAEGEAVYIGSKDKNILIDSGNIITGHKVVEFLKTRGIDFLDALIITHPHPDHMGGVFHILQQINVHKLYDNGESLKENKEDIYRWYSELFRENKNYNILTSKDNINMGKNINLLVLNPDKLGEHWNENSLVLKLTHKDVNILLMADAGIQTEQRLLDENISLKADLLKVGHHGSKAGTSKPFLLKVAPKFAVISINKNNLRGYPDSSVLKRLKEQNIEVFISYKDGDMAFESDGKHIKPLEFN